MFKDGVKIKNDRNRQEGQNLNSGIPREEEKEKEE
jgi:hypothetical protein